MREQRKGQKFEENGMWEMRVSGETEDSVVVLRVQ